jgi:small subunit ribosomal protein S16
MAVKMRLRREGKKKQPFYRVVVADARSPRDGRFIEDLGYYQPIHQPSTIKINHERALYWLRNGVQPSDAVLKLLRIEGIWEQFRPGDTGKDRGARPRARAAAAEAEQRKRRQAEQETRQERPTGEGAETEARAGAAAGSAAGAAADAAGQAGRNDQEDGRE